jgi:hypothetical protein
MHAFGPYQPLGNSEQFYYATLSEIGDLGKARLETAQPTKRRSILSLSLSILATLRAFSNGA